MKHLLLLLLREFDARLRYCRHPTRRIRTCLNSVALKALRCFHQSPIWLYYYLYLNEDCDREPQGLLRRSGYYLLRECTRALRTCCSNCSRNCRWLELNLSNATTTSSSPPPWSAARDNKFTRNICNLRSRYWDRQTYTHASWTRLTSAAEAKPGVDLPLVLDKNDCSAKLGGAKLQVLHALCVNVKVSQGCELCIQVSLFTARNYEGEKVQRSSDQSSEKII